MTSVHTRQESGDGTFWDKKRQEIALRLSRRGHNASFVSELSQESLAELERRLDKLESEEVRKAQRPRNGLLWFISQLVRNPEREKACELRLLIQDLAKDPLRARKTSLEKECNQLTVQLWKIDGQIQILMGYEDSEEQIARLEDSKARVEKELRQKQEDLARLN